jgi:hypothetical protein
MDDKNNMISTSNYRGEFGGLIFFRKNYLKKAE